MNRLREIKENIDSVLGSRSIFNWSPFRRTVKHIWQRIAWGFSDAETYSLDHTIAKFAYKRFKRFRKLNMGHPYSMTMEEWEDILAEIEWFLQVHAAGTWEIDTKTFNEKRYKKAGKLLGKHFGNLWW